MGFGAFPDYACTVTEIKVHETCEDEYNKLQSLLDRFGIGFADIARVRRYDWDYLELSEYLDYDEDEEGISSDEACSMIEKAYEDLVRIFEQRAGVWLSIQYIDEDYSGINSEYIWVVPLLLSRKLYNLDARIQSWVVYD